MDTFIARQPVLDKHSEIFGFEFLFRSNHINSSNPKDEDESTLEVLRNCYFDIGMNKIMGNKLAFIKFTANLLKSDIFSLIPSETTAVEISEDIELDNDIIHACQKLKLEGFIIVLNDFPLHGKYKDLINLADIVKIDFSKIKGNKRGTILKTFKTKGIKFLAKQVETQKEFEEAISYGYSLFQGNYFSKPIVKTTKKIPENKMVYLNLLRELSSTDLDFDIIESLVKRDISIAYSVLRFINSAHFGLQNNIKSLKQALTLLGEKEIKVWLYFLIMKNISSNKPTILLQNSLIRAKFCELIVLNSSLINICDNAYLMGMLSLIDVILDRPMKDILSEIMLPKGVVSALEGSKVNSLRTVLNIVIDYEEGNWKEVIRHAKESQISERSLSRAYLESCEWVEKRFSNSITG